MKVGVRTTVSVGQSGSRGVVQSPLLAARGAIPAHGSLPRRDRWERQISYLNLLRLHFFGKFQANVSTVNNDPGHFDNATFLPDYQRMQTPAPEPNNGWFNPEGDATWRFLGCKVSSAWTASGPVASSDPVLECSIADTDQRAPAKLVDLDPEQQTVSQIWGLQVRIVGATGVNLLRADFVPAPFTDMFSRALAGGEGDIGQSAMYQSVLNNLEWGDLSSSPFLSELRDATTDGLLSIKFNVDGINMDFRDPDFMCGRIAGTIGPATAAEPRHFVIGRQFVAAPPEDNSFYAPGWLNHCVAIVDEAHSVALIDLGNALPTEKPGTLAPNMGDLRLTAWVGEAVPVSTIAATGPDGYTSADWYARTAGIVVLPLSSGDLTTVAAAPLTIGATAAFNGGSPAAVSESPDGLFVRADSFVFRMSPGDTALITLHATRWGVPLANAVIGVGEDPSQLQPSDTIDPSAAPSVATPNILTFAHEVTTGPDGVAAVEVRAGDPGTPRYFNGGKDYGIDGQVYGLRPVLVDPGSTGIVNPWNFVSILVWSGFTTADPVTWDDISPVMQQYANLYPVMNRFLNMGDMQDVIANGWLLVMAFTLDESDPNSMPVTRDLSPAKRAAILAWLKNPVPGDPTRVVERGPARNGGPTVPPELARKGGKSAAMARRLAVRRSASTAGHTP